MDEVMLALTVISLIAAGGFAFVTWRTLADDRRRSAARVAALATAIDGSIPHTTTPSEAPVQVASMFTTTPGGSLKSHPLIKTAVVAAMGIAIVVGVAISTTTGGKEMSSAAAAARQGGAPLELVSMRHAREGTSLTVSGLVRNPRRGAAATRITAVVFAFDKDGTFVASGRAPLDFTTLQPGDESPFVVTIPNVSNVGRYRVSFRTEAGMLRHVDRRADQLRLATASRPEARP
jgi:hypothetical protein